jgi:hypothetical protein
MLLVLNQDIRRCKDDKLLLQHYEEMTDRYCHACFGGKYYQRRLDIKQKFVIVRVGTALAKEQKRLVTDYLKSPAKKLVVISIFIFYYRKTGIGKTGIGNTRCYRPGFVKSN